MQNITIAYITNAVGLNGRAIAGEASKKYTRAERHKARNLERRDCSMLVSDKQ